MTASALSARLSQSQHRSGFTSAAFGHLAGMLTIRISRSLVCLSKSLSATFPRKMSSESSLEDLQTEWKQLYSKRLPGLAKAKDPAQPKWPVQLDHCFARIILDNAVGKDRPWAQVVKSPAYKNMSRQQLVDAIKLGEKLVSGDEDLVVLDENSLALRGKKSKVRKSANSTTKKRKADKEAGERPAENESTERDAIDGQEGRKRHRRVVKSSIVKDEN